jgi:pimeloyl-ACP methyl ester carboxylesterase
MNPPQPPSNHGHHPLVLLASALFVLGLASCAMTPATLRRTVGFESSAGSSDADLHRLVEKAIAGSDSRTLGDFVERWKKRGLEASRTLPAITPGGIAYRVHFEASGPGCYPLNYFDELEPAAALKVGKIPHYRREGIGSPLVALRENRHQEPLEKYYPPEAITRPLTAVAIAGPIKSGVRDVKIQLLCPLVHREVPDIHPQQTLAADYSAPWAALLARTGELNRVGLFDVLTNTRRRPTHLYLMEAYDPKKEPIIMIHGLFSTPLAWSEVSNELWAEDSFRQRYQIWHYLYDTSAPALYSSRLLRQQLRELRQILDPSGQDPASKRTTLLAHSMGGIVSKAMVVRPGDAFWDAALKVPHETLDLSKEDRAQLQEAFEWQPDRTIHRIIFVAVPHRGSDFADNFIGRIGRSLTAPPAPFKGFYERISAANPGVFTSDYEALGTGQLDSISALSPRQPTLRILADLPFSHPLQAHSIIGDRGRGGALQDSSDGVVPYHSSHIEGAVSELIVHSDHWAYRHPAAIAEIKRILRLR